MSVLELLYRFNTEVVLKKKAQYIVKHKMDDTIKQQYSQEISYLTGNIDAIPYDLRVEQFVVQKDESTGLFFATVYGRRIYFPDFFDERQIQSYLHGLLREQADGSPHKYTDSDFDVEDGDIVVDLGAAEANFAFMVAPKAGKIILVEPDSRYNKAFDFTFGEYVDKVSVVNKLISDTDDGDYITIDTLLQDYNDANIFLKMDLEGFGLNALMGAKKTLKNNNCKIACACYHTKDEADNIGQYLEKNFPEYRLSFSKGYMFFWCSHGFEYPYFRKGIIRAQK